MINPEPSDGVVAQTGFSEAVAGVIPLTRFAGWLMVVS
jgi:hypothetical protein